MYIGPLPSRARSKMAGNGVREDGSIAGSVCLALASRYRHRFSDLDSLRKKKVLLGRLAGIVMARLRRHYTSHFGANEWLDL